MKTLVSAVAMILTTAPAFAHISVLEHEHPHGISWLPDTAALLMAAVMVGAGAVLFALSRRARK
ncbi:hypothetical protein [Pseudorhodoplanes sinuspersici]|uniref:Uncharacterized protein n=1 Tax=Pseudorhodoplanes sinuspersici TaxID=1235591 RepID=A0A1W6ZTB2_9HYPH|nr:hypothetical protein [Pseudorhodoplanes sinuspersici]ARQ00639.1 hypothetical protein CAK95_17310 [Pseudorhodoplanes sinuspersici]RKE72243.1 hypothetical protein DFP91_0105 [Pseudorhodoplanes sinuspersici]